MEIKRVKQRYETVTTLDLGEGDQLSITHGKFLNFEAVLPFAGRGQPNEDAMREGLLAAFLGTLVDWDLTDEGKKVPCSPENIEWLVKILPAEDLIPMFNQIMENLRPNPPSAGTSDDGSGMADNSENSPGGISSSESPDTTE